MMSEPNTVPIPAPVEENRKEEERKHGDEWSDVQCSLLVKFQIKFDCDDTK